MHITVRLLLSKPSALKLNRCFEGAKIEVKSDNGIPKAHWVFSKIKKNWHEVRVSEDDITQGELALLRKLCVQGKVMLTKIPRL